MTKNLIIAVLGVALIGAAFMVAQREPMAPVESRPAVEAPVEEKMCAQVITPARDPVTGDIREFPTPCDVPDGWEVIQNDIPDLELNLE